jgi:hypothetical protein
MVRSLILKGIPHRQVVERSGVSSGTVSSIRKDVKDRLARQLDSKTYSSEPLAKEMTNITISKTYSGMPIH